MPIAPSEMLKEEFLFPIALTQHELAAGIHVAYQRINELVKGKRGITPSTALGFVKFYGTTPGFWTNLQLRWDLYRAQKAETKQLDKVEPHIPSTGSAG
jgi:addiction module HigA family antidote